MRWLLSWPVALASLLGVDVWAVLSFFLSPFQVIGGTELHPPFFGLLACIALSVTMVAGGFMATPMLPSRRFHSLAHDMRSIREDLERFPMSGGWLFDRVSTLRGKMDRLKITTPLIDIEDQDRQRDWVRWLVFMAPLAETKNIRAARKWKPGNPLPSVETDRPAVVC